MEYVAKHTVKLGADEVYAPGDVVVIKDKKVAKALEKVGAIEERKMTVSEAKRAAAADKTGDGEPAGDDKDKE